MLFAPFAMQNGSAMATAPGDHHGQMIDKGHCGEQPASDQDGEPSCVAMCTAIAVASLSPAEPLDYAQNAKQGAIDQLGPGFLAELPTPPPRGT